MYYKLHYEKEIRKPKGKATFRFGSTYNKNIGQKVFNLNDITLNKQLGNLTSRSLKYPTFFIDNR